MKSEKTATKTPSMYSVHQSPCQATVPSTKQIEKDVNANESNA